MAPRTPSIGRALAAALRDAQPGPRDAGAVALAKRYAALLDGAAEALAMAEALVAEDDSQARVIHALQERLSAHEVAGDLGPKLLAVLAALGLTPAARAAAKGGATDGGRSRGADVLAELRGRRTGR